MQHEIDELLKDRFDLTPQEFATALKSLPAVRPWATTLTEQEARLLDDADFTESPEAYLAAGAEITGKVGHLMTTALDASEVAEALGVSDSRVRQKRLAGELWALRTGDGWVYPVLQFETIDDNQMRQIRGFTQVFKALPADLHPVAVEGFFRTPQPNLFLDRPLTPLEWLKSGADIETAVEAAQTVDWYER